MKSICKVILISILILISSILGITYWYISGHLDYNISTYKFYKVQDIQISSLMDVIMEIGVIGGIIPTVLFLIIYFLKMKIKNIQLFSILIIILINFFLIIVYKFFMYTIFHEFDTMIIFGVR